ncbi:hypothetical protein ACI2IP_14035 [Microbacterium sp. NPDC090218]
MTAPNRQPVEALPPQSPLGGHSLPPAFSSATASPTSPARRRNHRRLILGLLGGAGLVAALAITQVTANLGYDSAASRYRDAAQAVTGTQARVGGEVTDLRSVTDAAELILSAENRTISIDAELEAALTGSVAAAETAASDADVVVAAEVAAVGAKPAWFWELLGATTALEQHLTDADRLSEDLSTTTTDISSAEDGVTESGMAVLSAAGEAAAGFEAAHVSARNDAVVALRNAAADALAATTVDSSTATAYLALQDAATQVVVTEAEELAEKSGPLQNARLEIEAFARSLAPGVLMEFDWSPVVNGAGYNGSMGGYTTWWWDDPGRAIIELSNSVAEQWPAERSRALVAHEVGHAISVKCEGMYDSSTQDSIEKWATAWAISMGYTDDANGVWAYGYPPQNYIDAAAGCR